MVLDDPYFDAQWLRTAGHSGAGGAELGECLAVAGAIRGSDIESWYAVRLLGDYTLGGRAERISCPTLVCSAEKDEIGVTAGRLFDALTCEKEFVTFTAAEGAGAHCESGARAVFNQRTLDWLDRVLG